MLDHFINPAPHTMWAASIIIIIIIICIRLVGAIRHNQNVSSKCHSTGTIATVMLATACIADAAQVIPFYSPGGVNMHRHVWPRKFALETASQSAHPFLQGSL